jgi:hypothetical protein
VDAFRGVVGLLVEEYEADVFYGCRLGAQGCWALIFRVAGDRRV